ncbi:tRNA uridine-5-carboxymethylaminomethyl(34) synthesis GTPase MnmE [Sediminibacterium soli]|uniref:tRNA uridine-5-carboxymethylaminomethyl(34) synthesis GTPase MnmE n=1 Tax=Sediminibacterium soli TaxID=2698829 RepID=UPI00137A349D|nr:tRNA uridine-5-carboxymethylaminomethyl(34) synthesis GTPase MnmE [Sediminibacterium soli]NCI47439.1 tRNA uridine-5-carboxymethylaminomethyl(34) synthesis GTPase MnmE [Sediminibacterium soli]
MNTMLNGWDDTIAALATPPGVGAIGVIRVSGPRTFEVVNALFPSKDLQQQPSHTLQVGLMKEGDTVLDEVVLSLFKAPRSYTGEDVIEISCHGSPFLQQQVLQAITRRGVRIAKPGEFTQRAFLNGKMDLAQAESVADLIASNTEASRRTALHHMRGGFSTDLQQLREQLIRFSALIELELDFSQEDVEFADRAQLQQLIAQLQLATQRLLQSFQLGNVIKNGVSVAIIGKPNAGKSTLLNTLLNENRAIVSDIAGTTRDTIEEVLNIDGILFRLIDTAGIREHTQDAIESIGVERSREKMRAADIVLYLFDINDTTPAELQAVRAGLDGEQIKHLLIANKADTDAATLPEPFGQLPGIIPISARQHRHIDRLRAALVAKAVQGNISQESTIVTNARHYEALQKLGESLNEVQRGINDQLPGDLLALDIRQSLHYLGTITGQITNEDQLDFIFSKFCIGK